MCYLFEAFGQVWMTPPHLREARHVTYISLCSNVILRIHAAMLQLHPDVELSCYATSRSSFRIWALAVNEFELDGICNNSIRLLTAHQTIYTRR